MRDMTRSFVISCEYATCALPEAYREVFEPVRELVVSADGWDCGALNLAQTLATRLRGSLFHGSYTRLLLDLDRDGDERWSAHALRIAEPSRLRFTDREEGGYRGLMRDRIADEMRRHELLLHLSVRTRDWPAGRIELDSFGAGTLGEKVAEAWMRQLLIVGMDAGHNAGSGGSALAEWFGGQFPADRYAFVRLEVAQSFFLESRPMKWEGLKKVLLESLELGLEEMERELQEAAPEPEPEAEIPAEQTEDGPAAEEAGDGAAPSRDGEEPGGQRLLF